MENKYMKIAVFTVLVVLLINTIISGNAQAGLKTIDELRNELVNYKFEYATYIPDVEKMPILSVRLIDAEMKNEGEIEGYPSIINMDYEKYGLNEEGSKGTYPETTYDNVLMYDSTNKFGQIFASGQPSSAEKIILKGKQEIRNLKMSIEIAKSGDNSDDSSNSGTNLDVMRRLSQLEKIVYGKEE